MNDAIESNKFDFKKFAFESLEADDQSQIVPEIEANLIAKEEEKSDDCFKTRSGRTIQIKAKTVSLSGSDNESSEEDENVELGFKVYNKLENELTNKPKRIKPIKQSIKQSKTFENEIVDMSNKFVKLRKNKLKNEDLNLSADYVPLKKSNKSITIKDSLSEPLKMLENKMSQIEVNKKTKALSLLDEINLLLDEDSAESTVSHKKRKMNDFSDDDFDAQPIAKKSKKKKIIFSDDEDSRPALESVEPEEDCPEDDIQIVLDEDDAYESDENLLSSSSDEEEETDVKSSSKSKSRKLELKSTLVQLCNEAKESELMSVVGINKKVYEELISLRQFKDWSDLLDKIDKSASLTNDVIDYLSDYIKTKNVVSNIMNKCEELSSRIMKSVQNLKEHREPRCLNKKLKLKPYQLVGLNFLVLMFKQKLNCILGDEMGLGKTIQVIALLAYLREECDINGPHLIVVPSSVIANWQREFELWCPKIKILKYYGNQEERAQLRYEVISKTVPYDVIITTYNMLYSGDDKKLLTRVKFQYAVFDEAHMLKNMKSSRFKNLFAVKAKYRLMLTGTPVQNNLLELISLLTFTVPSLFYSKLTFMENFFKNKKFDDNKSEFVQEKTDQAKEILKPFILRRIKENVLKELPSKIEQYIHLDMTADQAKLYEKIVTNYSEQIKARKERKKKEKKEKLKEKVEIIEDRSRRRPTKKDYNEDALFYVEELDDKDDDSVQEVIELETKLNPQLIEINSESSNSNWSLSVKDDKQAKEKFGSILTELRKCANHPLLIRNLYTNEKLLKMAQILKKKEPYYQKDGNIKYMIEDMEILNDFDLHMLSKKFNSINEFQLNDQQILESGKFNYLDKALADFREKNQKVLIFSQFVMMLDIIEEYLNIKSIKHCRLDGSTKVTDRMDRIDSFKDKEIFVFLLSTRAGGMGINLVEANQVIIHDSDFNPYNDLQSAARAHRIGQTQEVKVYKLISDNTVEIHMKNICEEKLKVGKKITSDDVDSKIEESSDVRKLLKKALNL